MSDRAKLIFDSTERSADLFYATKFEAPDPYPFLLHRGKKIILLNDLELDRGRAEACVDQVDSETEIAKQLKLGSLRTKAFPEFFAKWLKHRGVRSAEVPESFPLGLANELTSFGIQLHPISGFFWPEREFKNPGEIQAIRKALRITEAGMQRAIDILKAARICSNGTLSWKNTPLTSERLRAEIDTTIIYLGGRAQGTIVASGIQACDPHARGTGILRARQLLILDIFPRDTRSGYYGDMTRTVLKGRASDPQKHLWETCRKGQLLALKKIRPGVRGSSIHEEIQLQFASAGYPTEQKNGRWYGFFHGTGHGLGLEIHEHPRFSATEFQTGQVLTVEPGLYYPEIGGVRHEDVVAITPKGRSILSDFPKTLEI